jgi:glyoxylase-like metal-dependent hydrolase (beta-lactamase superfamily II)
MDQSASTGDDGRVTPAPAARDRGGAPARSVGSVLTPTAGIHLIPIEYPSQSSPVNVYVVEDEPLTLVDTGPNLPDTLIQLEWALGELGHTVEDLERIVLTHPHIDHIGAASILQRRSGAEVWAPAGTEPWLGDYHTHDRWLKAWRDSLMLLHGVPEQVVGASTHGATFRNSWDPSVHVDRAVNDGDVIPFADRDWLVMFRPGHSPFDVLLGDMARSHILMGDHLIEHISSNALITPSKGQGIKDRPPTLVTYRRSLRQTAELPATLSLSGHGSPITDHRALIERRLASMDRRTLRIHQILADGPQTAHDVARMIWDKRAEAQAWLTISEVLGHIDRLVGAGCVQEVAESESRVHFECMQPPQPDEVGSVDELYM